MWEDNKMGYNRAKIKQISMRYYAMNKKCAINGLTICDPHYYLMKFVVFKLELSILPHARAINWGEGALAFQIAMSKPQPIESSCLFS